MKSLKEIFEYVTTEYITEKSPEIPLKKKGQWYAEVDSEMFIAPSRRNLWQTEWSTLKVVCTHLANIFATEAEKYLNEDIMIDEGIDAVTPAFLKQWGMMEAIRWYKNGRITINLK